MTDEITNTEDQLDSRNVQERMDYLEKENDPSADMIHELETLTELKRQYVDYFGESSWEFGAQFVRDSYFQDYAQELAEDCGMIPEGLQWPVNCIDWEQAARDLEMDYTEIDFDGVAYQTREA